MPDPVGVSVAVIGVPAHLPVLFQMLRMYALPVALKSAGAVTLSWGTAKAKYALGPPTKLGMSSFAPVDTGKITGTPSSRMRKMICGPVRGVVPLLSVQVDALFIS